MTLRVPSSALPEDRRARHGRLREYFCDKDAKAERVDGGWELILAWPDEAERHIDVHIAANLDGWEGIRLSGMASARRRSGRVLTSLYDTWSLVTWSEWVARAAPGAEEPITILHLDDHRDLMSPRLAYEGDGLIDMITGAPFDIRDPASVLAACESGAVGMGSFLTPFLLAFPNCDVRQLCQPPKVDRTTNWSIVPSVEKDDLLIPGADRPAIALEPFGEGQAGRYRATNDLQDWLADIGPGPVLLHVDMDYFNNRYDGDGDWIDRRRKHDPTLEEVLSHIDEVTSAMRCAGLVERIQDAAVAFSPGFFPADMWQPAEARLREGLRSLYD
ncbi:hypothetical protein [Sphingopyxis chilensis]